MEPGPTISKIIRMFNVIFLVYHGKLSVIYKPRLSELSSDKLAGSSSSLSIICLRLWTGEGGLGKGTSGEGGAGEYGSGDSGACKGGSGDSGANAAGSGDSGAGEAVSGDSVAHKAGSGDSGACEAVSGDSGAHKAGSGDSGACKAGPSNAVLCSGDDKPLAPMVKFVSMSVTTCMLCNSVAELS